MSVLDQIAYFQNRRDEVPNVDLARRLAESEDRAGIQEIADNLRNPNRDIQADCLKVLYEIGYLKPEMVAPFAGKFLALLSSRNNRLMWGAMIALSTIAPYAADEIDKHRNEILEGLKTGSVITRDAAVLTLARLAASSEARRRAIFPALLDYLRTCRPKDVPQHAEKILLSVVVDSRDDFVAVLEKRLEDTNIAGAKRVRKVIRQAYQL
jgi:hypothetical protein